jgi:hypothetical protein
LSVRFRSWSIKYFKLKETFIASLIIIIVVILANLHVPITFGLEVQINGTTYTFCYYKKAYPSTLWMRTYNKIHLLLYSALPFLLIFLANLLLIKFLIKKSNHNEFNRRISTRRSKARKTIMIVTITFILMTLPGAVCSFFYSELLDLPFGSYIILFFDCVTFSYHSFHIFFLYFSNKLYKKELKNLFYFRAQSNTNTLAASNNSKVAV